MIPCSFPKARISLPSAPASLAPYALACGNPLIWATHSPRCTYSPLVRATTTLSSLGWLGIFDEERWLIPPTELETDNRGIVVRYGISA